MLHSVLYIHLQITSFSQIWSIWEIQGSSKRTWTNLGRSYGLAHVCTKIRCGKFGGYRLKENDVCGLATFKLGIAMWEGPIAYLMLVQFLETNVRPLYIYVYIPKGSNDSKYFIHSASSPFFGYIPHVRANVLKKWVHSKSDNFR